LNILFSLTQRVRLPSQASGQIAADQRDHQKQQEVDDLLRILDRKAEDWRKKEEIRRRHTRDRREGGRPDAPLGGGDNDGDQIGDWNEIGRDGPVRQ
jgi:hypothetical protein